MVDQWNGPSQGGMQELPVIDPQDLQNRGTHVLGRDRSIANFTGRLIGLADG